MNRLIDVAVASIWILGLVLALAFAIVLIDTCEGEQRCIAQKCEAP